MTLTILVSLAAFLAGFYTGFRVTLREFKKQIARLAMDLDDAIAESASYADALMESKK